MKNAIRSSRGFTLIELIVVIGIMGVLAGLLLGGLSEARKTAKIAFTKTQIRNIETGVKAFESEWGFLPLDSVTDLTANMGYAMLPGSPSPPQTMEAFTKERSNAVLMFQLFIQKKSGPYIEAKEDDMTIRQYTVTGDTYANITTKWNPKYTNGATLVFAPLLLDAWGNPLVYDLNNPETGNFNGSANKNTRSFDIYSFGSNELDNEGDISGTDNAGINLGSQNDDINNW